MDDTMARYSRLKVKQTVISFAIASLVAYIVLMYASSLFPWQQHHYQLHIEPTRANDVIRHKDNWNGRLGNDPLRGRNHPDNFLTFRREAGKPKCNTTITFLAPSTQTWHWVPEHDRLRSEFARHSTKLGDTNLRTLHVQCPSQRCDIDIRVTTEQRYLNTSDAIIMNMFPSTLKKNLLKLLSHYRQILNPNTHWFFYGIESLQTYTLWNPKIAEIQYHHSITYHSEADIYLPLGKYLPNHLSDEKSPTTTRDWSANKTGLVAWMASNAKRTFWPRLEYVNELKKHVSIDVWGDLGNLTCFPRVSKKCATLMARYKFYLALENSECDEYISAKVWRNALSQGAVPVVYGNRKEAYQRLLPPGSFIHIGDFDSVAHLASYLKTLDHNTSMYNAYHAWRQHGSVQEIYPPLEPQLFCEVVPFVFTPTPAWRTVKNSGYFKSCKTGFASLTKKGSLKSFVPWK